MRDYRKKAQFHFKWNNASVCETYTLLNCILPLTQTPFHVDSDTRIFKEMRNGVLHCVPDRVIGAFMVWYGSNGCEGGTPVDVFGLRVSF